MSARTNTSPRAEAYVVSAAEGVSGHPPAALGETPSAGAPAAPEPPGRWLSRDTTRALVAAASPLTCNLVDTEDAAHVRYVTETAAYVEEALIALASRIAIPSFEDWQGS